MRRGGLMSGANPYGMLNAQVGNYYAGPSGAALGALVAGQAIGDAFRDLGGAAARRQERADAKVQQDRAYGLQEQQAQREQQMFGWKQQEADQARLEKNRGRVATYWAVNGGENTDPGGKRFMEQLGYNPYEYADNNTLSRMQDRADQRALQERMAQDRNDTMRAIAGMRQGGGAPKIPTAPGYETIVNPDGTYSMRAITGGPADMKIQQQQGKAAAADAAAARQADIVIDDIDRAMALAKDYSLIPNTGFGAFGAKIPNTNASDLAKTLDSIKANVGFDKLQEMRRNSPTGAALGAVSDNENKLLQSVLGSLDQSQSEAQFLYNLNRLKRETMSIVHGTTGGQSVRGGSPAQQAQQPANAAPSMPELPPGARLVR